MFKGTVITWQHSTGHIAFKESERQRLRVCSPLTSHARCWLACAPSLLLPLCQGLPPHPRSNNSWYKRNISCKYDLSPHNGCNEEHMLVTEYHYVAILHSNQFYKSLSNVTWLKLSSTSNAAVEHLTFLLHGQDIYSLILGLEAQNFHGFLQSLHHNAKIVPLHGLLWLLSTFLRIFHSKLFFNSIYINYATDK